MEMSRSLLSVEKKAVMSFGDRLNGCVWIAGLAVFREHVLSLFRQRIKNVNITSLASARKLNAMIFNTRLNPLNRRAGLVIPSLLLISTLCSG